MEKVSETLTGQKRSRAAWAFDAGSRLEMNAAEEESK